LDPQALGLGDRNVPNFQDSKQGLTREFELGFGAELFGEGHREAVSGRRLALEDVTELFELQAVRDDGDVAEQDEEGVAAARALADQLEERGPVAELREERDAVSGVAHEPQGEAREVGELAAPELEVGGAVEVVDEVGEVGKVGAGEVGGAGCEESAEVGGGGPASGDLGEQRGDDEGEWLVLLVFVLGVVLDELPQMPTMYESRRRAMRGSGVDWCSKRT